jgi:hypothetical protein
MVVARIGGVEAIHKPTGPVPTELFARPDKDLVLVFVEIKLRVVSVDLPVR